MPARRRSSSPGRCLVSPKTTRAAAGLSTVPSPGAEGEPREAASDPLGGGKDEPRRPPRLVRGHRAVQVSLHQEGDLRLRAGVDELAAAHRRALRHDRRGEDVAEDRLGGGPTSALWRGGGGPPL